MRLIFSLFAAPFLGLAPLAASAEPVDLAKLMAPGALPEQALGNPEATVTVIEYASLTCPHCGRFYKETFPAFKEKYVDTGKVHFIYRDYPLDPLALAGSMLARCGNEGTYFEVIDTLFLAQDDWTRAEKPADALATLLAPYGITADTMKTCLDDKKLVEGVVEIAKTGNELGVNGTPSFFINGEMQSGGMTISELSARIDALLSPAQPGTEAPATSE